MTEFKPLTVGKIDSMDTLELDKRVEYLIYIRERLEKSIQAEIDYIYSVVENRGKA
jgi:hypothetical protein